MDSHHILTPMDTNSTLTKTMSPSTDAEKHRMKDIPYLAAVRSTMYMVIGTRPNIAYTVQHLSCFSTNPGQAHWTATQHILHYLYSTKEIRPVLSGKDPITLTGWLDSDWASDTDDQKSISGYIFMLGSGTISWSSKKLAIVATSLCEAEYIACDYTVKEAMWL